MLNENYGGELTDDDRVNLNRIYEDMVNDPLGIANECIDFIGVERDYKSFQKHLFEFHASGTSLHEENGYYFTVNDKFREMIDNLVKGD